MAAEKVASHYLVEYYKLSSSSHSHKVKKANNKNMWSVPRTSPRQDGKARVCTGAVKPTFLPVHFIFFSLSFHFLCSCHSSTSSSNWALQFAPLYIFFFVVYVPNSYFRFLLILHLFLFLGIGWILLCSILYSFLLSFFPFYHSRPYRVQLNEKSKECSGGNECGFGDFFLLFSQSIFIRFYFILFYSLDTYFKIEVVLRLPMGTSLVISHALCALCW